MEMSNKTARELYQAVKAKPNRGPLRLRPQAGPGQCRSPERLYAPGGVRDRLRNRPAADRICERAGAAVPRQPLPGGLDLCGLSRLGRGLRGLGHAQRYAGSAAEHQGGLAPRRSSTSAARSSAPRHRDQQAHGLGVLRDQPRRSSPSTGSIPWWSPAARRRAACARPSSTACRRSYRTVVPEECVSDKHESPHYANLYDMALKYADVLPVAEVAFMEQYRPAN